MWLARRLAILALAVIASAARAGSLDQLAAALAAKALPDLAGAETRVTVTAPAGRLAEDLSALLVTRLRSSGVRIAARGAPESRHVDRQLRIELELVSGKLRASGMVFAWPSPLWSDEPEARAHLYAEAVLDDELLAYLPPARVTPGAWQTRSVALGDLDVLALDVGDTDGDGRAEVVVATASELVAWSISDGPAGLRALERWRVRFEGRPAPLPPRAELATASVESGGAVARASSFDEGVRRVAAKLERTQGYRFPGLGFTCELEPGVDWFTSSGCHALSDLPERFWTAAGLRRAARIVTAAIVPGASGGTLWLRETGAVDLVRDVGAQVALAPLERGDVVVTSEGREPGEPDALVVRAIAAGTPLLHRVDPLPGAVCALGAGDADGDGRIEIVAAIRDRAQRKTELWLVR